MLYFRDKFLKSPSVENSQPSTSL